MLAKFQQVLLPIRILEVTGYKLAAKLLHILAEAIADADKDARSKILRGESFAESLKPEAARIIPFRIEQPYSLCHLRQMPVRICFVFEATNISREYRP